MDTPKTNEDQDVKPGPAGANQATKKPRKKTVKKAKLKMKKSKPVAKSGEQAMSKSDAIREAAAELKAKGERVRGITIVALLKTKGIEVVSPQVSMVLKKAGYKTRKRRESKPASEKAPVKAARANVISVEDLLIVKKSLAELGSADRFLEAIAALKRLS